MTGATGSRVRRALRWFVLGSGPLKRRSDRIQAVARVLVVLAVLATPAVGVAGAGVARHHLEATAAAQAAERHVVQAVVTASTTTTVQPDPADAPVAVFRANVTWPGPAGAPRSADVPAPRLVPVGSTLPVWVDRGGSPTAPPLDPARTGDQVATVVIATVMTTLAVTAAGYGLVCLVLDAARRRRWARDWARFERQWRTGSAR